MRVSPVATFVILTVAVVTRAPFASFTVPVIVPVICCAGVSTQAQTVSANSAAKLLLWHAKIFMMFSIAFILPPQFVAASPVRRAPNNPCGVPGSGEFEGRGRPIPTGQRGRVRTSGGCARNNSHCAHYLLASASLTQPL